MSATGQAIEVVRRALLADDTGAREAFDRVVERLLELHTKAYGQNKHIGSCAGCFFAAQHIEDLHDMISGANPQGWAASNDLDAASEWAKLATELMALWPKVVT
jgi:GrpB-like predicted nucleotidyltransferase (UPF0157 family)